MVPVTTSCRSLYLSNLAKLEFNFLNRELSKSFKNNERCLIDVAFHTKNKINKIFMKIRYPCEICNIVSLTASFRTSKNILGQSSPKTGAFFRARVCARTIRKHRIARDRHFAQPAYPKFNFTPGAAEGAPFDVIAPRASLPPVHVLWLLVEHVCGPSLVRSECRNALPRSSSRRP